MAHPPDGADKRLGCLPAGERLGRIQKPAFDFIYINLEVGNELIIKYVLREISQLLLVLSKNFHHSLARRRKCAAQIFLAQALLIYRIENDRLAFSKTDKNVIFGASRFVNKGLVRLIDFRHALGRLSSLGGALNAVVDVRMVAFDELSIGFF